MLMFVNDEFFFFSLFIYINILPPAGVFLAVLLKAK